MRPRYRILNVYAHGREADYAASVQRFDPHFHSLTATYDPTLSSLSRLQALLRQAAMRRVGHLRISFHPAGIHVSLTIGPDPGDLA